MESRVGLGISKENLIVFHLASEAASEQVK
jgi:hypothetical protein